MSFRFHVVVSLIALAFANASFAQTSADKPERIRGTILSYSGGVLQVHRRSGETVGIAVVDASGLNAVKAIQLSDIKPGAYVGAAALFCVVGLLVVLVVLVFFVVV